MVLLRPLPAPHALPALPAPRALPALPALSASLRRVAPVVVPENLTEPAGTTHPFTAGVTEIVILGAGCAGLSLCLQLLEAGMTAPILIIDRRTGFVDDRTWCWWDVEPTPFSSLAFARWEQCEVSAANSTTVATSSRYPYLCLAAADFYADALNRIAQYPNVTLRLATHVDSVELGEDVTLITAGRETFRAHTLIDARGLAPDSNTIAEIKSTSTWLAQQFLGQRIRTSRPVFDPDRCMLMDFSVSQKRALRFVYVLPVSTTEALIENVYLANISVSAETHRAEIDAYVLRRYGLKRSEFVIDGEEAGYIPMTDHTFVSQLGERAYAIGMRGGSTRPSTGYTFLGIQREVRALALTLTGISIPTAPHSRAPLRSRRLTLLDAVFLKFLVEHPTESPAVFARMFRTNAETLIRFLSETSTLHDELALVLSLPKMRFVGVATRVALRSATAAIRSARAALRPLRNWRGARDH